MVLVRERHEEVALSAGLALAVLETRRLDGHASCVRRQAERGGDRVLARSLDDASEGRADVLGVATHRAAVETEALAGALLLVAIERNAEEILHREQVRDHRRGEHAPLHDLLRRRRGHDAEAWLLRQSRGPPIGRGRLGLRSLRGRLVRHDVLVHDALRDEATMATALVGDPRGHLDADALGFAFELGVRDLDAHLWQIALVEISSTARWGARPTSALVLRLRLRRCLCFTVGFGATGRVEDLLDRLRLGQELVERELRVGDVVEPLGFRDDEAPLEQVQLLEELVVADAKIRERAVGTRELIAERRVLGGEDSDARIGVGNVRARRVHDRFCMHARDRCRDLTRYFLARRSMNARTTRASRRW